MGKETEACKVLDEVITLYEVEAATEHDSRLHYRYAPDTFGDEPRSEAIRDIYSPLRPGKLRDGFSDFVLSKAVVWAVLGGGHVG